MDQRSMDLAARINEMREKQGIVAQESLEKKREAVVRLRELDAHNLDAHLLGSRKRDLRELVLPLVVFGFYSSLFFSGTVKEAFGVERLRIDLLGVVLALGALCRAYVRITSNKPLVALSGDEMVLYGAFKYGAVPLHEIVNMQIIRDTSWCPFGAHRSRPNYRLQITVHGKKSCQVSLTPSQVTGGLLTLRRFANLVADRLRMLGVEEVRVA